MRSNSFRIASGDLWMGEEIQHHLFIQLSIESFAHSHALYILDGLEHCRILGLLGRFSLLMHRRLRLLSGRRIARFVHHLF